MKPGVRFISLLLTAALLFTGCSMQTVDKMYQLPKRSEEYNDLQSAIDGAMAELEYCAPLSGENQQTVQAVDLDGDGSREYLLFAKGTMERPLRILIFQNVDGTFVHVDTIESTGTAFDQVEYVQMDGRGGSEIVVGRQVSDQVLRSVSVYTFFGGEAQQLISVNYTKFLTTDLDRDSLSELFVLRPGATDTDNGIAELYGVESGKMERSNEVNMSQPADKLKRILVGALHGGQTAVYAASTVDETAIITDVYTIVDGKLANVSLSNESGTSVQTMRNYYVYADDIDEDGVVEIPSLIKMAPLADGISSDKQDLIRWYAMTIDGAEVDKLYTYHNFVGGWYMRLESQLAPGLTVINHGQSYEFYLWDSEQETAQKLMTVYTFSGQNRDSQSVEGNRFILLRTESVIYAASLEICASDYGLSRSVVTDSFHLIQQDWKTGET